MNGSPLLLIGGAVILLILLLKLIFKPVKLALKLLIHAAMGFAGLFLLNFFGSSAGIVLPLTWGNALVAGLLGVPGLILLVLLKLFAVV